MERTGIEQVTSGLQSHQDAIHNPTPTDQVPMVEPKLRFLVERHSTPFDSTPLAPRSHGR